jgi:hypothetical protein
MQSVHIIICSITFLYFLLSINFMKNYINNYYFKTRNSLDKQGGI